LRFIDLCQWHVNLGLYSSTICDWDTEDHKLDGEFTMQKYVDPSAQVRLKIASATSFSIYRFILTYRQTAHVPLTIYIDHVYFSWVVYKIHIS